MERKIMEVKRELTTKWWLEKGKEEIDYWLDILLMRGYKKNIHIENFFEAFEAQANVFDKNIICQLFKSTYKKWRMEISDNELLISLNEEE